MTGGLREYWDLPVVNPPVGGNAEFGQDFRAGLTKVNRDLQVVAVHGAPGEHQTLDSHRQTLIKAYQTANSIGDAAKNGQVMGAVAKVEQQTSDKAAKINAGHDEWQKRQPTFDAAIVKIGELEDANHPTAPAFRKVSEAIQARAKGKDYQNANAAFDQLQPKLDAVISQTTVQAGTGDGNAPGGNGGSKDPSKPAVVSKETGTIDSVSSRTPSNNGGTIDTTGNPDHSGKGTQANRPVSGAPVMSPVLPDSSIVTIQTANGPAKMTVDEYRWRRVAAENWVTEQMSNYQKNRGDTGLKYGDQGAYERQAAKKFGLDEGWARRRNVPGTNASALLPYNADARRIPPHIAQGVTQAGNPQAKGGDHGAKSTVDPYGKTEPARSPSVPDSQELEKLSKTAADASRRTNELSNKIAENEKLQQKSLSHTETTKLKEKRTSYQKEYEEIRRVYEDLDRSLRAKGIQGSTTSETFSKARDTFSKAADIGKKAAPIFALLVTGYMLFQQIKQIIEAETDEERWKLTVQLVKGAWTGMESFVGATVILGSAGRAVPVLALVNLSSDSPNRNYSDDKQELLKKNAEEKVAKIADDLMKNHPDSVHWDAASRQFKVDDPKLWEQAVKKFELVEREQVLKAMEAMRPAARAYGVTEALSGKPRYDQVVLKELFVPAYDGFDSVRSAVLNQSYQEGFKEGQATRSAALKRAGELGSQDGKAGKPEHMEEVNKMVATKEWAEVDDTSRTVFHAELVGAYKKAYDAAAPAGTAAPAPSNITAGEAVMRDKREAALKRAHDLGLKDGKTGKKSHVEEIQKWTEVTEIEGPARGTFLAELIEIYNKEFASVAPADAKAPAPSNITAGEKIAREKKEAALKRARECGLRDAKSGTKSGEEIQKWTEVTELEGPARATFLAELIQVYNKAFTSVPPTDTAGDKVQLDKSEAAIKRAHELGLKDGKTGKKSNLENLQKFPEVTEFGEKGGMALHGQLVVAYSKAFASVAPATPALLKRASELGQQDAKAGMALHMPEIGKWPEVQGNAAMLQQLMEAYNKALQS